MPISFTSFRDEEATSVRLQVQLQLPADLSSRKSIPYFSEKLKGEL